jgi:hypothetical protein
MTIGNSHLPLDILQSDVNSSTFSAHRGEQDFLDSSEDTTAAGVLGLRPHSSQYQQHHAGGGWQWCWTCSVLGVRRMRVRGIIKM